MNLIDLGVRFVGEPQTSYTNDGNPVHEVDAEFAYTDHKELVYAPIKLVKFGEQPLEEGIVSGQFRVEKYERPDGKKTYTNQIVVNKCISTNGVLVPFNSVVAIGGCGKDPEVKYFESGSCLAETSLATKRYNSEFPDWHNLQFWGKSAQTVADYVRKGAKLAVNGELVYQTWNDRGTGEVRYKAFVKCFGFEFVGSKKDSEESGYEDSGSYASKPTPQPVHTPASQPVSEVDYDDIPF